MKTTRINKTNTHMVTNKKFIIISIIRTYWVSHIIFQSLSHIFPKVVDEFFKYLLQIQLIVKKSYTKISYSVVFYGKKCCKYLLSRTFNLIYEAAIILHHPYQDFQLVTSGSQWVSFILEILSD